ncbi:MAG: bifunctional riboflavin kinase/FAD synthetase [Promicromonosporaceae bacterium]|nr:bifunctional riboflavin kinase/FAD synthetase [Promicromonosporaceae bacterium]
MLIWRDPNEAAAALEGSGTAVTIGNFDGVHLGHQAVLRRVVEAARDEGCLAVAITFDPHPVQVHRPDEAPPLLTALDDRLALFAKAGLDAVLVIEYTLEFATLTPGAFVQEYLVDGLRVDTVVLGHDARFGVGNTGSLPAMVRLGLELGFEVVAVDDVGVASTPRQAQGGASSTSGERWSSTGIRTLLAEGDVTGAARELGRPYALHGTVIHGDARGRTLGFPTANLGPVATMIPADGVYAGWLMVSTQTSGAPCSTGDRVETRESSKVTRAGFETVASQPSGTAQSERLPAAISIGTNPTFNGIDRRVEAHVLDRDDLDLYGEEVTIEFAERLRPTLRFTSIDELITQMHADVAQARALL